MIIQGRSDSQAWVRTLKIKYSLDGSIWQDVDEEPNFLGLTDSTTKKRIIFKTPPFARIIKLMPITYYNLPCLRFDALYLDCRSVISQNVES